MQSPVIGADGTIYVTSGEGVLCAVAPTGKLKWKFRAPPALGLPALAGDGTIFVMCRRDDGPCLYAVTPEGKEKWRFSPKSEQGAEVQWADTLVVTAEGAAYMHLIAYGGKELGSLFAVAPDGKAKWIKGAGALLGARPSVGSDGRIWVADSVFTADAQAKPRPDGLTGRIQALDASGTIYTVGGGHVYAFSPGGEQKWHFEKPRAFGVPAVGADGTVYVATADSNLLYALGPDGKQQWRFTAGDALGNPVVDAQKTVCAGSKDGTLYAIGAAGKLKWKLQVSEEDALTENPALGDNGCLYVTAYDTLYAIE